MLGRASGREMDRVPVRDGALGQASGGFLFASAATLGRLRPDEQPQVEIGLALPGEDLERWSIAPWVVLPLMIAAYIVGFTYWSVRNHAGFHTGAFDIGIFDQGVWHIVQGDAARPNDKPALGPAPVLPRPNSRRAWRPGASRVV